MSALQAPWKQEKLILCSLCVLKNGQRAPKALSAPPGVCFSLETISHSSLFCLPPNMWTVAQHVSYSKNLKPMILIRFQGHRCHCTVRMCTPAQWNCASKQGNDKNRCFLLEMCIISQNLKYEGCLTEVQENGIFKISWINSDCKTPWQ